MAEDFVLDAVLEVDDQQIDDVNNELEANVEAEDGGQEEGGGLFTATNIVLGILTAILSQLQGATSILDGLFKTLNLILTPIWQGIASAVRPLADLFMQVAQAVQKFGIANTLSEFGNQLLNDLTSFINSAINSLKTALNQIPGVNMDTGDQAVSRQQTSTGVQTAGTVASGAASPAGALNPQFLAEGFEQATTLTADLQDEESKETWASIAADMVDEVI